MQRRALRLCGAIALLLCATVPGKAQISEVQFLRIESTCDKCPIFQELTLELNDLRNRQRVAAAAMQMDGAFILRDVPYGDYQLLVIDHAGNAIHQEFISVSGLNLPMQIHLAPPKQQPPPAGGISVAELRHPPSKKAFQALLAAQKLSEAGDYGKAAEQLEKAVEISPYYVNAYTNLAVQHIRLGRYQEAARELEQALEIGGPDPVELTDLATAQYSMKQLDAAAQSARAALQLQPGYPRGHLVLGLVLCTDTRTVQEGLQHLRKAAETIPAARIQIDRVNQALATR